MTGTIAHEKRLPKPSQLVVKLEDGSRFDGGGPRIYDIYPIVNGVERRELLVGVSKGNWKADFGVTRKTNDPNKELYTARYFLEPLRVPNFFEFNELKTNELGVPGFSNILHKRFSFDEPLIEFSDLNKEGNNYLECNGEDYLQFWFTLPADEEVDEVIFKAYVGNNYILSLSEVYENVESNLTTKDLGPVNATYFEPVLYSKGDVKDLSNLNWVTFEHGLATANMLMSFRVDTEIKGFKLVSEYSRNMRYRQFSSQKAGKFRNDAEAYYINIMKELGKFTFGTEYFKFDPDYSTSFVNMDRELW